MDACGFIPGCETAAVSCVMFILTVLLQGQRGRLSSLSGPSRGDGGGGSARGGQREPLWSQSAVRPSEHHHQPPGFSQRAGRRPPAAPLTPVTCLRVSAGHHV